MGNKVTNIFLTLTSILLVGCNSAKQKETDLEKHSVNSKVDTLQVDKVTLKESFHEEDTAYNEYIAERLQPIRENFKRINSIAKWASTYKGELDESTEGGEVTFYYSAVVLEKIVTIDHR